MTQQLVSFVIPVFEEEETIITLYQRIKTVMGTMAGYTFEIIFIDDGSRDHSWDHIKKLVSDDPGHVKAIQFRHNVGKAHALSVGFKAVSGDLVFTMDADLQDDPEEIPNFINTLNKGYDLVSGWKQKRHDPISKTLPSKLFNLVARGLSGVNLHDFNCGFKLYRGDVLKSIKLYGDLHRYIPILANAQGFRVGEMVVTHHPRQHGVSKYGWERYVRGFLDLLTVLITTRFVRRPAHFFGGIGILFGLIGFLTLGYLTIVKCMGQMIGHRPLLFFGVMFTIMAVQFISLGLIAELFVHNSPVESDDVYIKTRLGC